MPCLLDLLCNSFSSFENSQNIAAPDHTYLIFRITPADKLKGDIEGFSSAIPAGNTTASA
jgi:hypothetical protein